MIRINLLAVQKKKRTMRGPANLVLALIIVNLSALVLAGAAAVWVKAKVSQLKEQSTANQAIIQGLTKKITEIKNIEKLNKELEKRSTLIETLRKNQSVPVRVLDEVSMLIPEGIWLNALTFKDNGISLEGNAFSNIDIVAFMDNLKRAADITEAYLVESREGEIDKVKVYRFKANFKVKA